MHPLAKYARNTRTVAIGVAILGLALKLLHFPYANPIILGGLGLMWISVILTAALLWVQRVYIGWKEAIRVLTGQLSAVLLIHGVVSVLGPRSGNILVLVLGAVFGVVSTILAYIPGQEKAEAAEALIDEIGKSNQEEG